jgi:chemotaxis signal transduction protein
VSRGPGALRVLLLSDVAGPEAGGSDWLLPAAAVAEVVGAKGLAPPPPGAPGWLIGTGEWRGISLPAVRLGAPPVPPSSGARGPRVHPYLAICRGLVGDPALTFFAIESPRLPRLEQADMADLSEGSGDSDSAFVLAALCLKGQPANLVDLESLERSLLAARPWA